MNKLFIVGVLFVGTIGALKDNGVHTRGKCGREPMARTRTPKTVPVLEKNKAVSPIYPLTEDQRLLMAYWSALAYERVCHYGGCTFTCSKDGVCVVK